MNKLEERSVSKRWISVDRHRGLLLPEESVDVAVTVTVDRKTAQLLNLGRETLDDVLVLRVENCQDQYASVSATFERSCYGMSLEELVYIPGPVRLTSLPSDDPSDVDHLFITPDGKPVPPKPPALKIPKEVWRIIDALWKGGALKEKDLFVPAYASASEVRKAVERKSPVDHLLSSV
jgi:phosphatidylinositol-bisphosphatase